MGSLCGKELVRSVINFEPIDVIPRYLWWYDWKTIDKLGKQLADLHRNYPDDMVWCFYSAPSWGLVWEEAEVGGRVKEYPLSSWDKLDEYIKNHWPDPDARGIFNPVLEAVAKNENNKYLLGIWWFSYFERMHSLRGMENLFIDLHENVDKVVDLGNRLHRYFMRIVERYGKVGVDGVMITDDWGSQNGLMISVKMWREIFKPWYKELFEKIRNMGMDVWMHSCGCIVDILEDLIEIGLQVINPIQYEANDWERVRKIIEDKLVVFGSIDVQEILTRGTAEDVSGHIDKIVEVFHYDGKGLIFCPGNTIMPETPIENIRAMYQATEKYRGKSYESR